MLFALSAAAHAPALMDAGKKAWAGYKGAKGAVDAVRKFRRAPEEMRFTFQLCSALLDVLPVAEALAIGPLAAKHLVRTYHDQLHGWAAARGDRSDPRVAAAVRAGALGLG